MQDILAIRQTRQRTARTWRKHDRPVNAFNYLILLRDKVATSATAAAYEAEEPESRYAEYIPVTMTTDLSHKGEKIYPGSASSNNAAICDIRRTTRRLK